MSRPIEASFIHHVAGFETSSIESAARATIRACRKKLLTERETPLVVHVDEALHVPLPEFATERGQGHGSTGHFLDLGGHTL